MSNNCICPKCDMENAYFNGIIYYCPDCDYEWNKGNPTESETSQEISDYEKLAALDIPFFKLEHGKLYDCIIEHCGGIEFDSIIPLAFEKGKNRQFVMHNARNLFKKNPDYIRDIIKMDFDYIMNDGIRRNYPSEYDCTIIWITQSDGTLLDFGDAILFDFRITNEI